VNRADLVAAAVERLLPTPRLLLFGDLVAAAPGHELVAVLASHQPTEVVTGGGRITTDEQGIHGTSLHGDRSSFVSWEALASYLRPLLDQDRLAGLADAYRRSVSGPDSARTEVSTLRSILAYDVVTAANLVMPSMLSSVERDRVIIEGAHSDADGVYGLPGEVSIHAIGDTQAACCVNGQVILTLRATPDPHRVGVVFAPHGLGEPPPRRGMFSGTIRHVPPGDVAGPLPATFGQRVGVDVLEDGADGLRWVVQVDGFDVATMDATGAVPAPTVRTAIYDNDPAELFHRFDGTATVSASRPPPRDVGAAINRLDALTLRPPTSNAREP
jgi:hypothetical protein